MVNQEATIERLKFILIELIHLRSLAMEDYRYELYELIDAAILEVGREIDKALVSVH